MLQMFQGFYDYFILILDYGTSMHAIAVKRIKDGYMAYNYGDTDKGDLKGNGNIFYDENRKLKYDFDKLLNSTVGELSEKGIEHLSVAFDKEFCANIFYEEQEAQKKIEDIEIRNINLLSSLLPVEDFVSVYNTDIILGQSTIEDIEKVFGKEKLEARYIDTYIYEIGEYRYYFTMNMDTLTEIKKVSVIEDNEYETILNNLEETEAVETKEIDINVEFNGKVIHTIKDFAASINSDNRKSIEFKFDYTGTMDELCKMTYGDLIGKSEFIDEYTMFEVDYGEKYSIYFDAGNNLKNSMGDAILERIVVNDDVNKNDDKLSIFGTDIVFGLSTYEQLVKELGEPSKIEKDSTNTCCYYYTKDHLYSFLIYNNTGKICAMLIES